MNYDLFKKILRRIGTGMKINAACLALDSDQDLFYDFLYSDPKHEDLFRQALARRTDFIVDQIGELLEVHPDVDRLKLIRDYWLQVIKSQNSTTYGERKSVDLNIGMHERQLKEVLAIEMAKETTLDQLQDMNTPTIPTQDLEPVPTPIFPYP